MQLWQHIAKHIEQVTGAPFCIKDNRSVGGGCINASFQISNGEFRYFVKTNHSSHADMFEVEAEGLQEMANSNTIRVPRPVCYGEFGNQCYIVMEYLDLAGGGDNMLFGQQLAAMHKKTADRFGWHMDNTIGSTPQYNNQSNDWIEFWRKERLGFQLDLAASNGYGGELQMLGERLMADFPVLFESYHPKASMLHGDLWTGNYGALADGTPVIFDPAFYYGDREAELAMTTLFGSFSRDFYAAYNEAWPLDQGYTARRTFYNIYHIINHTNLFGGAYHGQAISMIEQVLSEIR
ncbi:MAG: fructosamine kinase family protein [Gammaproteobacteria bacterium]|nr:fructosamine kinase family protein [Gammaproteobacteria bacterium]